MEDRDKTFELSHEEATGFVQSLIPFADNVFESYPQLIPESEFFSGYDVLKKQLGVLSPGEPLVLDFTGAFSLAYLIQFVFSILKDKVEEINKKTEKKRLADERDLIQYHLATRDEARDLLARIADLFENNEPMLKALEDVFGVDTGRAKRLQVDTSESIVTVQANESNQLLYTFLFNVWDYILLSDDESEFAMKLRKNPLLHLDDYEVLKAKMLKINEQPTVFLSLRDAIILYWVLEITCRMFATDAGDLLEEMAVNVVKETGVTFDYIRSFIIKNTSSIMKEMKEKMTDYPLFHEYADQAHQVEWE